MKLNHFLLGALFIMMVFLIPKWIRCSAINSIQDIEGEWGNFMGNTSLNPSFKNGPIPPLELKRRITVGGLQLFWRVPVEGLAISGNILVASTWFHVKAFNMDTGRELWRIRVQGEVANSTAALLISEGRVFWVSAYKDNAILNSADLRTGRKRKELKLDKWGWEAGFHDVCRAGLNYCDGSLYLTLTGKDGKNVFAVTPNLERIIWSQGMEGQFFRDAVPALSQDLVVVTFRTSASGYLKSKVAALAKDTGEVVWEQELFGAVFDNLCVSAGKIYVVTDGPPNEAAVFSIDLKTGELVILERKGSGPVAVAEGLVVLVGPDYSLRAIDPISGRLFWEQRTIARNNTRRSTTVPPVIINNYIYLGSHDGYLRTFNLTTGELLWEADLAKYQSWPPKESPAVYNLAVIRDKLVVACSDGMVYILGPEQSSD